MTVKKIQYKGQEVLLAKSDLVFKALFTANGDLELLASLLSCILDLNIQAEDMVVTNTELPPAYEKGKLSRIDVRVKLADGKHINAEIQLYDEHNIAKRSIFYLSRLYIEQMTTKMDFVDICPVIAINILDFNFLPFDKYHNRYRLKNLQNNHELTDVFELNFIELKKVLPEKKNSLKDLWMIFLSADSEEALDMCAEENPILEKAVNKLLYVSADEKLRYELDMREKAELDYRSAMRTNYDRGVERGKEEGREEAEEKTRQMIIEMKKKNLTDDVIADIVKLSIEKIKEIYSQCGH